MRRLRVVVRVAPPSSPMVPFVAGSLVFHAAASLSLAILPALHPKPPPKEDAWIVGLSAPPGPPMRGGSGAATPIARAPAPPRPKEAVRVEEPKAASKPRAREKKEEKAAPPREPSPKGPSGNDSPPAPAADAGSTAGPGGASGMEGGGIFSVGAGDLRFAWYRASVTVALQQRWIRPVLEDAREALSVTVTFEIERDGSVRDVEIETSSGVPSLDRSAIRAVEQAAPLPPLPAGWDEAPFPARFEFRWSPAE